jgi:hypothetical protein
MEQDELAPSLATGRSPPRPPEDDVPYDGASAVVLTLEHALLPSPHERMASLLLHSMPPEGVFSANIYLHRQHSRVRCMCPSFARVIPLPRAIGVWLFAVLVAYCLYRIIVLHVEEEEEEEGVQVQAQINRGVRPPV